jgi:putative lipoic acid-binding regulatory protein
MKQENVIKYPTQWRYKVIGIKEVEIINAIEDVLLNFNYNLKPSKKSSKGKFLSYEISLIVENQEQRDSIFSDLKNHTNIKYVI